MSIVCTNDSGNYILLGSVEDSFDTDLQAKYNPIYINVADELSNFNRIYTATEKSLNNNKPNNTLISYQICSKIEITILEHNLFYLSNSPI